MAETVLGLDVGGANLKAATSEGLARLRPFALWRHPDRLADELAALLAESPACNRLAVTMTGELCDCYPTKRAGVAAILDAVERAAAGKPIEVWLTDRSFVPLDEAKRRPLEAAASNWLALAVLAGRHVPQGAGLLLDIGSTTTDLIPLWDGKPLTTSRTDTDRLKSSELLYVGVRRTPICAVLGVDVMAEFFATTHDAFLLLGEIPEDATDTDTADGRPATMAHARARLARTIGGDVESVTTEEARRLAERVKRKLLDRMRVTVQAMVHRMTGPLAGAVVAGSGEFLARELFRWEPELVDVPTVSLAESVGAEVSVAACAYAVATLSAERFVEEVP